jgi:hypothetical protein
MKNSLVGRRPTFRGGSSWSCGVRFKCPGLARVFSRNGRMVGAGSVRSFGRAMRFGVTSGRALCVLVVGVLALLLMQGSVSAAPPAGWSTSYSITPPTSSGQTGPVTVTWQDSSQSWTQFPTQFTGNDTGWYIAGPSNVGFYGDSAGYYDQAADAAWQVGPIDYGTAGTFGTSGATATDTGMGWGSATSGFQLGAGTVVPEPSALALLTPAILLLVFRRRSTQWSAR